jgi:hypothetical protein
MAGEVFTMNELLQVKAKELQKGPASTNAARLVEFRVRKSIGVPSLHTNLSAGWISSGNEQRLAGHHRIDAGGSGKRGESGTRASWRFAGVGTRRRQVRTSLESKET